MQRHKLAVQVGKCDGVAVKQDQLPYPAAGQYLNSLRMEKARFLLARTDLSMLSISKLCGIATQQYFSRCFKRCSGVTPQEYRRTYAVTCDYRSMRTADTIDFREV